MKLHLIQSRDLFGPPERQRELVTCWQNNERLFNEYTHPEGRPTFTELFRLCKPNALNVIANSDIYFDAFGILTAAANIEQNTVYALSRYDVGLDGRATLWDHGDSQDTWMVYGGPYDIDAPFTMGVAGCDNALLHILRASGFTVINPSLTIASYHLHNVPWRSYLLDPEGNARGGNKIERVPPPYAFAKPERL